MINTFHQEILQPNKNILNYQACQNNHFQNVLTDTTNQQINKSSSKASRTVGLWSEYFTLGSVSKCSPYEENDIPTLEIHINELITSLALGDSTIRVQGL